MANSAKRLRRLWDEYAFPGFRPLPTVRGVFGDRKARVITFKRRSKKRSAVAVVERTWAGTTDARGAFAICTRHSPQLKGPASLQALECLVTGAATGPVYTFMRV